MTAAARWAVFVCEGHVFDKSCDTVVDVGTKQAALQTMVVLETWYDHEGAFCLDYFHVFSRTLNSPQQHQYHICILQVTFHYT